MMAEQADQEIYIYMGGDDVVPRNATRVRVHESVKFIPERAFYEHPNLVEFECHNGVETIEKHAFYGCPSLRRVKIPGVTVVKEYAFFYCEALTDVVDCDKLETIGHRAFVLCKSLRRIKMPSIKIVEAGAFAVCHKLRSITLPSIEIVEGGAFNHCQNLMDVTFGENLERFEQNVFDDCPSLKRITIPLKDGIITDDDVFQGCRKLGRVDLVGGIHKTISALQLEDWRKDMNEEIGRINRVLPNTPAGSIFGPGGKTQAIRIWIQSVLRKMEHYKAEHRTLLKEAATTLELALWKSRLRVDNNDVSEGGEEKRAECRNNCGADMSVVIPNVLSFLKIE